MMNEGILWTDDGIDSYGKLRKIVRSSQMSNSEQAVVLKHLEPTEREDLYKVSELPCCPTCERVLVHFSAGSGPISEFLHCTICNDYAYSVDAPYQIIAGLTGDF